MKPRSGKAKGRKLQQNVVRVLRHYYHLDNGLESFYEGDIQSVPMGMAKEDIRLSPLAQQKIPFNIECKNQERLNIWSALEQTKTNSGDRIPLLVFKRNRSKTYACLPLDDLLELSVNGCQSKNIHKGL